MKKIKLVLADGNRLFVESLQRILEKEMDTAVISGANSGVDALRSCIEDQPDIAVVGELLPRPFDGRSREGNKAQRKEY